MLFGRFKHTQPWNLTFVSHCLFNKSMRMKSVLGFTKLQVSWGLQMVDVEDVDVTYQESEASAELA